MGPSEEMPGEIYTKVCRLLDELRDYGIFIVQVGTLERWLTNTKDGNSDELFISLLKKIDKTEPSNNDIWQFLDEINNWMSDSNRKGMIV